MGKLSKAMLRKLGIYIEKKIDWITNSSYNKTVFHGITNLNVNSLAMHTYDIGGIEEVVGKKSLAVMPLFHGFGLVICVHTMLCLGFHVYLLRFSALPIPSAHTII